jgi:hypothetical protein
MTMSGWFRNRYEPAATENFGYRGGKGTRHFAMVVFEAVAVVKHFFLVVNITDLIIDRTVMRLTYGTDCRDHRFLHQ